MTARLKASKSLIFAFSALLLSNASSVTLAANKSIVSMTAASRGVLFSVVDGSGKDLLAASSPNLAVSLNEGSEITAYVKLNRQPISEVRLSFASSGLLELDVYNQSGLPYSGGLIRYYAPPVLIFDSSNWNVPQTFSIRSIEDGAADGIRTLPVRISISSKGKTTLTEFIWIHSLDSGAVTSGGSQPFISSGSLEKIQEGGQNNGLTRLSNMTALASYDGAKSTAKFRVNSRKLNVKNRLVEFDYTLDSNNKAIIGQVRGFAPRDLSLDLNYVPVDAYFGASGLTGVMTVRQRGVEDTFFVTSTAKDQSSCDINQYAGKWYEQGAAKKAWSAKLVNATYTYTPQLDGTVRVEYVGKYGNINGAAQSAIGVATPIRDFYSLSTNTRFNVLYSSWNSQRPPSSDYRIVDFAPDYSWAIASDSLGGEGVVLTREQIIDDATYRALLNRAGWLGVDTKKFRRTTQIAPP